MLKYFHSQVTHAERHCPCAEQGGSRRSWAFLRVLKKIIESVGSNGICSACHAYLHSLTNKILSSKHGNLRKPSTLSTPYRAYGASVIFLEAIKIAGAASGLCGC